MTWKINIHEAIRWELPSGSTLLWELTDAAERELNLGDTEATASITVDGDYFVVAFELAR